MVLSDLSRYLVFRNPITVRMKSIVSQYLKVAVKQMVSMELTGEDSILLMTILKGQLILLNIRKLKTYGLPWWLIGKEPSCQCRRCQFNTWIRKISNRRKWQSTPIFMLGKFLRQRSLMDYSPWSLKRVRHNLVTKQPQQQNSKHTCYQYWHCKLITLALPWGYKLSSMYVCMSIG